MCEYSHTWAIFIFLSSRGKTDTLKWLGILILENTTSLKVKVKSFSRIRLFATPGSSIHGTFQARALEWVAISFSRGSSWPRDRTQVSHIVGRHFTIWVTRELPTTSLKRSNWCVKQLPPPSWLRQVAAKKVITLFWQHRRRLYTWTSPDGQYRNHTDYILCSQRWRSSI